MHLRNVLYLKNKLPSDSLRYLGNSPDSQLFGEFPRFRGIWEISHDSQAFEEFPKFLKFLLEVENGIFLRT